MKNKTCYKKDCLFNDKYVCLYKEEIKRNNDTCTGFKKGKYFKEGERYFTQWHMCKKEESQDVVVFSYPLGCIEEDKDISIRCCTCGGIISNNLSREEAKNLCKRFNFNVVEGSKFLNK